MASSSPHQRRHRFLNLFRHLESISKRGWEGEALSALIAWPSHGTRFSAQSLLCPRMDSGDPPDALTAPETLGFMLSEAKELLHEVQKAMVSFQTTRYLAQQISSSKCGAICSHKGKHQIVVRTLFGKLRLDSPRLYHCGCCSKEEHRSFSPLAELLPERTTPELAYLESKFAAMISYGLTAKLLAEVLPTGGDINVAGVSRNSRTDRRTDGGGIGRRKVAIHRWVSARLGCAASAGATAHHRIGRRLYPRQGPKVSW